MSSRISIAEFHQSDLVDFAVWVLIQYGLEIPPFDNHRGGMKKSSSTKPERVNWERWFHRLVLSQHCGLHLQTDEEAYLKQQRERLAYWPFVFNGEMGLTLFPSTHSNDFMGNYREVVAKLSDFSSDPSTDIAETAIESPVDLWEGSDAVKAELEELWLYYQVSPNCRVHHESDMCRHIIKNKIHPLAQEINDGLQQMLKGTERLLMFNLVNYYDNVFAVVGSSVVIGLDKRSPFSPEALKEQVFAATGALIDSDI